ncbi:MAG TPA: hypothetical protein VG713_03735 [Pirellulales bacterium]|nr:hypothetical protein [Pirellulales bacterium]
MTRCIVLLAVVLGCVQAFAADEPPARNGEIVDTAGVKTTLTEFNYRDPNVGIFDGGHDAVALFTNAQGTGMEIMIPNAAISSITFDGGVAEVKYRVRGSDATLKGRWALKGLFYGHSDGKFVQFPDFKVKTATFTTPPSGNDAPLPTLGSTMVLTDGSSVKIAGLNRQSIQQIGRITYFLHFDDMRYTPPGASDFTTTKLADIASIELGNGDDVVVTLKSGTKAAGKLPTGQIHSCLGFTGICDLGPFRIDRTQVKSIQLGP